MTSNLTLRVLSALFLGPLVFCAIWFDGEANELYSIPLYTILLALFGAGLAWEWDKMFNRQITVSGLWTAIVACMVAFIIPANPRLALCVALMGTAIVYIKSVRNLAMAFGVLYICIPLISLGYIYYMNDKIARELILWLFFIVWATDIGGYVIGCTFKGPKIAPSISAKKTWSGFFGGIGFASIVAYVFALYLKAYGYLGDVNFDRFTWILVGSAMVLSVFSQVGDFFESYIKRRLNLKDSSNLIPGHGGLFDRVDGLLFASTVLGVVLFCLNQGWF